jgi:hypothetical protein
MKDYVFLILILLLAVVPPLFKKVNEFIKSNISEGFNNYTLGGTNGIYPCSETNVLVQDTYPITGINGVSDQSASKMWWRYPTFEVGSFKQITNNIRYPYNPDDGKCTAANFCYALYKNKNMGSNIVTPLPPVDPNSGTRVGYFATNDNLLPFRTDVPNILY